MPPAGPDKRSSQRYRQTSRYKDTAKAIGSRARELREGRGLTLEQASAAMDLDLKHLQKVEAGQVNVTLVTVLRVADGLGVPPAQLFGEGATQKRRKPRGRY